jgi:hypothetical protein
MPGTPEGRRRRNPAHRLTPMAVPWTEVVEAVDVVSCVLEMKRIMFLGLHCDASGNFLLWLAHFSQLRFRVHHFRERRSAPVSSCSRHEDQFDARRNAQLIENMKQVVRDRVFAKIEFVGDLAILQAIAQEAYDIFLSFGQQLHSACIRCAHGCKNAEGFQYMGQFAAFCPDLSRVDAFYTPAECLKRRLRWAKDTFSPANGAAQQTRSKCRLPRSHW